MSQQVKRLFKDFQPENYQLELFIDPKRMTFQGFVNITGQKKGRPSKRLVFHQKGLKVHEASITAQIKKTPKQIKINRIVTHKAYDEVRLHTTETLFPGEYKVNIKFSGNITHTMEGIYPCHYNLNGREKLIIASQFESHYAREAFPCIDEPEAKATFQLSLVTPNTGTAISNTVSIKQAFYSPNKVKTIFEVTPRMSTYLLAFVYGDLKYLEAKTKNGTKIRTYATASNVKHTKFALETAVKCLDFYENYYGIAYPLTKCDLVALPDFAAGAMENWGLITFREQAIIVDPAQTSLSVKQYVAKVVAHELAHQWFGNLVTMRWWTDLWLNEGFASWMEYFAVDHIYPKWQIWIDFLIEDQEVGLKLDALENTHAIEVEVKHPDEIHTIFDSVSYSKGASVIKMLHDYLGDHDFQFGLRHYLTNHAYANTDTADLWSSLEAISKRPVKAFMQPWTTQPGFPLLTVKAKNHHQVVFSQEKYQLNQTKKDLSLWQIPLLSNQVLSKDVLSSAKLTQNVPKITNLLVNTSSGGFYRTLYNDESTRKLLLDEFKSNSLSAEFKIRLLSDSLENAKAGYLPTDFFLKLIELSPTETNNFIWDIIVAGLGSIRSIMNSDDLRDQIKPFGRSLASKQLARLGWQEKPKESLFDTLLRPTILALSAVSDNEEVINHAQALFKNNIDKLDPNIRPVVYSTVARHGGDAEYAKLLKLYNATDNSEQKITIAAALTNFKQPELIERSLGLIDSKAVRLQDVHAWIAYSFMNHYAKDKIWQWLIRHWDWLESNLGSDLSFSRMPIYAARSFNNDDGLDKFNKFFESKKSPLLERTINQGVEIIKWQTAWYKRDYSLILNFFKDRG